MKTILVVDDEQRIRSVYSKMFNQEGFNVLQAANANEANEMLLFNKVDLILLDINMPEVDGTILYDIAQLFHQEARVIVSSVYPIEDQKMRVKGALDYFDKSDGVKVLVQKVKSVI